MLFYFTKYKIKVNFRLKINLVFRVKVFLRTNLQSGRNQRQSWVVIGQVLNSGRFDLVLADQQWYQNDEQDLQYQETGSRKINKQGKETAEIQTQMLCLNCH